MMAIYPRFSRGQRFGDLSASAMTHWVNRTKRLDNIHGGEGLQVSDTPGGVRLTLDHTDPQVFGEAAVNIRRFSIITVLQDYIECRGMEGDDVVGELVFIAKPYLLRQTPFHGLFRNEIRYQYNTADETGATRTAFKTIQEEGEPDREVSEQQLVIPKFVLKKDAIPPGPEGDPPGEPGWPADEIYAIENPLGGTGVSDAPEWLDLNVDGRAWASGSSA